MLQFYNNKLLSLASTIPTSGSPWGKWKTDASVCLLSIDFRDGLDPAKGRVERVMAHLTKTL